MTFIDTHAHIYHHDFPDHEAVVQRALAAGVQRIYMPNVDEASIEGMQRLQSKYPQHCYQMMGLHPCHVGEDYAEVLDRMYPQLAEGEFIGVGEIGIDLYWDKSTEDIQIDAYRTQIEWARELGLPFVIHSRDALDLTISIVEEMQDGSLKGIFHCFNGSVEQGKRIVELGFYMGIGGVLTYKNAGIDVSVEKLPIESMVLETDAPYLTPVQYRKKGVLNEPAFLPSVAERLARVMEVTVEQVAETTSKNAMQLFHPSDTP